MESFFSGGNSLIKLLNSLKKRQEFSSTTRDRKIKFIEDTLKQLQRAVISLKGTKHEINFKSRYLELKAIANECLTLLNEDALEATLENIEEEDQEEAQEKEEDEEEEDDEDDNEDEDSEDDLIMPPKLDIGLALKLVKPFDGSVTQLTSYIESVELLGDYAEGVPEADTLKFLRTTLTGAAHGAIDTVATIDLASEALRHKFAIKVTLKAVENEMHSKRQNVKTISEFGSEIEKLTAKLASAHVSAGTFANEAAASNIVEPIAVNAFIDGLKDPSTRFFLKARNPTTLNKAISDALECQTAPCASNNMENMMALWCTSNNFKRGSYTQRGNYPTRGRFFRGHGYEGNRGRGNNRGRGYYHQQTFQNQQYSNNNNNNNNRGYYRGQPQRYSNNSNYRGRGNYANIANASPQQQQQQRQPQQQNNSQQQLEEEANLIDLFR